MPFYDDLGEKYDLMIRWKARLDREAPFLQRLFGENRIQRVLDLGCGTGHHARLFNNWGCQVVGLDASESLLKIARSNGPELETLTFLHGTFEEAKEKTEEQGPYDAVLSLGNSLPHMLERETLVKVFEDIFALLKPGGVFVFQNRNYDRLLKTRERFQLPTTSKMTENEQLYFRFNDFESEERIRFNIVHFRRVNEGSWLHDVYSTDLHPWKQADLADALREAGFAALDFYGDFSGTPFDPDTSTDLVGLVRKPALSSADN